MSGRTFSAPELVTLFGADGDWYQPAGDGLKLDDPDLACVDKLKQHEKTLRRNVCIEEASEAALVSDIDAYLWHTEVGMTGMFSTRPYPERELPQDPGFNACKGKKGKADDEWFITSYTFELGQVTNAAKARQSLNDFGGMPAMFGNYTEEAARKRFEEEVEGWFDGAPVRTFKAVALGEDHLGEELFEGMEDMRCVGPADFLGSRWVCAGIAIP
jgi:hypothetical protein